MVQTFTAEQLEYRGDDPWNYFDKEQVAHKFLDHRRYLQNNRAAAGKLPIWTPELELKCVQDVYSSYYGEPYVAISWTEPELDIDHLPMRPVNRRPLPSFKLPYSKLDEIQLRLNKTMIMVKGNPFYIRSIKPFHGKFYLNMVDHEGKAWRSKYDDIPDLRSPPAMYISANDGITGWMQRVPERIYQQGLCRNNTAIKGLGAEGNCLTFSPEPFLKPIATRKNREWTEETGNFMAEGYIKGIRLSDNVAAGRVGHKVFAFYRGRTLGEIKEDHVLLQDGDDLLQDWITRDARDVGLTLKAA